jgi:hypothetical protein
MEVKMGAKPKYLQYTPEILEMNKNGKTDTEIVEYLNGKYRINIPKSSIRTIIDRESKKQINAVSETKQEPLPLPSDPVVKELQEKLPVLLGKIEKSCSKQEETALLQEKSLNNLAKLEAKYADGIEKHSILNETLHEIIIRKKEERDRKYNPYLITGICILAMTFPMVAGYHSKRYDDEMSFHYILVLCYILGGILRDSGLPW